MYILESGCMYFSSAAVLAYQANCGAIDYQLASLQRYWRTETQLATECRQKKTTWKETQSIISSSLIFAHHLLPFAGIPAYRSLSLSLSLFSLFFSVQGVCSHYVDTNFFFSRGVLSRHSTDLRALEQYPKKLRGIYPLKYPTNPSSNYVTPRRENLEPVVFLSTALLLRSLSIPNPPKALSMSARRPDNHSS